MKIKEQYRLAHRYWRAMRHLNYAKDAHSYPIGFDCSGRFTCPDPELGCACEDEYERDMTALRVWKQTVEQAKSEVDPAMLGLVFREIYGDKNEPRDFGKLYGWGRFCHFAGLVRSGYVRRKAPAIWVGNHSELKSKMVELFFAIYPGRRQVQINERV